MVGEGHNDEGASSFVTRFIMASAADQIAGREDKWFSPGAYEVVWPHPLLPEGRMSDLRGIKDVENRRRVESQEYEIINVVEAGDVVVVEAAHRLNLTDVPGVGTRIIHMNVAFVFTLREKRICRLHVYRCQHS